MMTKILKESMNSSILTPFTIVGFPEELCSIFSIHSSIGRMSKPNNHYWFETEHFFNNNKTNDFLKRLTMTSNLKTNTLVSKFSPELKYFAKNIHLHILLNTLIPLSNVKRDLKCTLLNVTPFNY